MFFILFFSIQVAQAVLNPDKYSSFEELAIHEEINIDFQIRKKNCLHPVSIFAIHGGRIEPFTSEIALALAGESFNYYLFEGIKSNGNKNLHIKSESFNEPQALALSSQSNFCISIHGFNDFFNSWVCIGGHHQKIQDQIFNKLKSTGLIKQDSKNPCQKYFAVLKSNIVNRCKSSGVQIEVSSKLRNELSLNPKDLEKFADAIRQGLKNLF